MSGIMAILFNGIVMSHYSHFNLSTVTQITMQQTMRTLAFICETCVFSYLGLAIFSFKHQVEPALVIWSLILCLVGRAANIFPLSWMVNKFRTTKITPKMSFIMVSLMIRSKMFQLTFSLLVVFGSSWRNFLCSEPSSGVFQRGNETCCHHYNAHNRLVHNDCVWRIHSAASEVPSSGKEKPPSGRWKNKKSIRKSRPTKRKIDFSE